MWKISAGLVLLLVASACSTESKPVDPVAEAKEYSQLACEHFRNVMRDAADGVLTDAELRVKLKEVDDDTGIATPEVQAAGRAMLKAITAGDVPAFTAAIKGMGEACTAAGF